MTLRCQGIRALAVLCLLIGTSGIADATITTRDLATLRDISGLSISPDGRWAAFAVSQADPERNAYDIAWNVMEISTRRVEEVARGGELRPDIFQGQVLQYLEPSAPVWSPDARWFAYLRSEKGSTQVWRANRTGAGATQLTRNDADIRKVAFSRDGQRLFYETEPSRSQLAAALAAEGRVGFRFDERFRPLSSRTPTYPRDVDLRAFFQYSPSQKSARRIWAYELARGDERLATETEQAEFDELSSPIRTYDYLGGASALSRGGARAWAEARDPSRKGFQPPRTIVAQLPGSSESIVCPVPECTTALFDGIWWPSDEALLYVRREGLRMQDRGLYEWRPIGKQPPRLILRTTERLGASIGCAVPPGKFLCLYEQSNYPRRLVAIDLESGAIETLFDPNPSFARFDLGAPPKRIAIRASSGVETYGYLVLPPSRRSAERLPLVIVTYRCGGFLRGGTGDEYPIFPFAAVGFAVLCFDAPDDTDRQATMSARAYVDLQRGPGIPHRSHILDAFSAAIAQLDELGIIDPERVGITGLSYGAEMVGFAMTAPLRGLIAAITSGDPGPSPAMHPLIAPVVRARRKDWGIGSPDQTPEPWKERSFTTNLDRVRAPLLMNVSDGEMLTATIDLVALQDAGRVAEMYVFPDEPHVKWQPAHRLAIYERNIAWLRFWLQDHADPDPAKADQYARWRKLRDQHCKSVPKHPACAAVTAN